MVHSQEDCPLDRSRLVFLSGAYGGDGFDLTVTYCPRCDVAFTFVGPTGSATPPAVLQWHRQGDRLDLRPGDRVQWEALPHQFRECWESNVRHHVLGFVRGRDTDRLAYPTWLGCPKDGCPVPVLHRVRDGHGTDWLFTWCRWCRMGFLFAADPAYGWEHCAGVVWDGPRRRYDLLEQYRSGGGQTFGAALLAGLPPFPSVATIAEPQRAPDRGGE